MIQIADQTVFPSDPSHRGQIALRNREGHVFPVGISPLRYDISILQNDTVHAATWGSRSDNLLVRDSAKPLSQILTGVLTNLCSDVRLCVVDGCLESCRIHTCLRG